MPEKISMEEQVGSGSFHAKLGESTLFVKGGNVRAYCRKGISF